MTSRITLSDIRESPRLVGMLIGLLVASALLLVRNSGWVEFLDLLSYDLLVTTRVPSAVVEPRVVLVTATEDDIEALAEWPLSDATIDRIFQTLEKSAPRAIGLDIYRDRPVPPGSAELEQTLLGNDRIIVVKKFGSGDSPGVRPPAYLEGSQRIGFTDTVVDADGVVRRGLLFMDDESGVSFGLAIRLALTYLGDEGIWPQPGEPEPSHLRLGEVTIPPFESDDGPYVDADAAGYQMLLDYREGAGHFPTVTLAELLNGEVADEVFRDRMVIIGVAAESVKDVFFTPFSKGIGRNEGLPGAMVHAYLASQLVRAGLEGDRPLRTVGAGYEYAWILLWCALGCLAGLLVHSFPRLLVLTIAGLAVIVAASYTLFMNGWWFSMGFAAAGWMLTGGLVTAYLSGYEHLQRGVLMQLFSKHVSEDVADEIWKKREEYFSLGRLRSRKLPVTVMFTDVEHFTTISEKLDPEALMNWLNDYMEIMANLVIEHGGVIDDYHGDAIMADFGVPIVRTTEEEIRQDAINAVRCALAMGAALAQYNRQTMERGLPRLRMRVGIASGYVVAGCLGSSQRMKFTVIGDTVNTAARIETMDKEAFGAEPGGSDCRIMMAETTRNYIADTFATELAGSVMLRGKSRPVRVYRVDRIAGKNMDALEMKEVTA